MYLKQAIKTGVFLVIAAIATVFIFRYLLHFQSDTYLVHVTFKDAKGLVKQSFVRMQGVQIGEVASVDLNTEVRV